MEVKLNIPILLEKSSALALEKKSGQTESSLSFFFSHLPLTIFKGNCTFQWEGSLLLYCL